MLGFTQINTEFKHVAWLKRLNKKDTSMLAELQMFCTCLQQDPCIYNPTNRTFGSLFTWLVQHEKIDLIEHIQQLETTILETLQKNASLLGKFEQDASTNIPDLTQLCYALESLEDPGSIIPFTIRNRMLTAPQKNLRQLHEQSCILRRRIASKKPDLKLILSAFQELPLLFTTSDIQDNPFLEKIYQLQNLFNIGPEFEKIACALTTLTHAWNQHIIVAARQLCLVSNTTDEPMSVAATSQQLATARSQHIEKLSSLVTAQTPNFTHILSELQAYELSIESRLSSPVPGMYYSTAKLLYDMITDRDGTPYVSPTTTPNTTPKSTTSRPSSLTSILSLPAPIYAFQPRPRRVSQDSRNDSRSSPNSSPMYL